MGAIKGMCWFYGLLGMIRFLLDMIENRATRRFSLVLEYDSDGSRRKRETDPYRAIVGVGYIALLEMT